jgi:hypothetical protein
VPLLGKAAVAMWWDMAPVHRVEFEDWHSHEHFPERMSIPGFLRGSRWANSAGGDGFFVMYELDVYDTLTSTHYLARLNDPTPWSTKMMPWHRDMVRSQCRVVASFGGGIARSMATTRLSPAAGQADTLQGRLMNMLADIPSVPGITGGHLLQTHTPEAAVTQEQAIRGGADAVADWIVLVSGYDAQALAGVTSTRFGTAALADAGAQPTQLTSLYNLAYALTASDL